MSDGFTIDDSEIVKLAADLGTVPATAGRFIRQAVEVSARHVKDDWKEAATGFPHAPAFPYSISYDIGSDFGGGVVASARALLSRSFSAASSSTVMAEIGPDKGKRQGALGNLMEYGSQNNPPMGLGAGALERVQDDFEQGLSFALRDGERAAGL